MRSPSMRSDPMCSPQGRAHRDATFRKNQWEPDGPFLQNTRAADTVIGSPPRHKMHWSKQQRGHQPRVTRIKTAKSRSARAARTGAGTAPATASTTALGTWTGAEYRLRLHWQQAFALQLLARQFAG